ncbi:hypothetical protein [Boudabousia tangfeifanii]|uniref:carboxylate--amine ligase n=1 Tax=Boudabousia tangfeifanii TaxID=1912795 RepID=UPI0009F32889|nr:hypothetical protein [Boudabousia tangfeifanii]
MANSKVSSPSREVSVVFLGSDTGIYALARSFHEAYGIKSHVVTRGEFGPIANSNILTVHEIGLDVQPNDYVDYVLAHLDQLKGANQTAILLTNTDHLVEALCRRKDELDQHFFLPLLPLETYEKISEKQSFFELCQATGVKTPLTMSLSFGKGDKPKLNVAETDLDFPVIAKPALSADYEKVKFAGQHKVYQLSSQAEVDQLIATLEQAGFEGEFVFQHKVVGDDTTMRSLTAYVDGSGQVTLLSSARVLLEDHAPGLIGVPLAMVTETFPDLAEGAKRLLAEVDYRGFANFDVKVDANTGEPFFLEVNPRIGRNAYYACAGGANPAVAVMRDLLGLEVAEPMGVARTVLYRLVPLPLLVRYLDPDDVALVKRLKKQKAVVHPLAYRQEKSFARWYYVIGSTAKQFLKFRKYYPKRNADAI